jgi:DNA-binding LacI/PurR family transcriptional regulator
MSVSIKDIARQAGVSHSTVSRALRNSPLVNERTGDAIRRLAREMGYTPSAAARSLVTQRTRTVGLVVTALSDPFIDRIVDGIEDLATSAGYGVLLGSSHADPERELGVVEMFHQQRVDGVIVVASRVGQLYAEQLQEMSVPIVLINNEADGDYLYSVSVDDQQGARLATDHLLSLGHRRIAYIGSATRRATSLGRQSGYERGLREAGFSLDPELVYLPRAQMDIAAGREALPHVLEQEATAMFCFNDRTAIGALLQAREQGVSLPGDLSVVGFDDIEPSWYLAPPLTTIHQPRWQMGRTAMEMLLGLLDEKQATNRTMDCRLVVRGSTAPPAAK